jgi:hypothetical protein
MSVFWKMNNMNNYNTWRFHCCRCLDSGPLDCCLSADTNSSEELSASVFTVEVSRVVKVTSINSVPVTSDRALSPLSFPGFLWTSTFGFSFVDICYPFHRAWPHLNTLTLEIEETIFFETFPFLYNIMRFTTQNTTILNAETCSNLMVE